LINELTAEIGSTYASLRHDAGKNEKLNNYKTIAQKGFHTEKKNSTNFNNSEVVHTEPSNKQCTSLFSPVEENILKLPQNYFTRAHPISPPGSSYDAITNGRQGLPRTYSSSSVVKVSKTDIPKSYLERIANKIYDHISD
jgi:hypothetical protein